MRKIHFVCQNISPYWADALFIKALRKEALENDK